MLLAFPANAGASSSVDQIKAKIYQACMQSVYQ